MKRFSYLLFCLITLPGIAASVREPGRMVNSFMSRAGVGPAPRAKASSSNNGSGGTSATTNAGNGSGSNTTKNDIQAQKDACLRNNTSIDSVFVWASKYSNTKDYSTMIEDITEPENNVCFVKVGLDSDDPAVDLSDMPYKYVVMGNKMVCGNWVEESVIEERVLSAKKKGRVWASVGVAVGGAAVGVGAMELFGNKLIGGAVEGQADLQGSQLVCSQLKVLKTKDEEKYNQIKAQITKLKEACNITWEGDEYEESVKKCRQYNYKYLSEC